MTGITSRRALAAILTMVSLLVACAPGASDPCKPPAIDAPIAAMLKVEREFSDTVKTAASTARIGLAPVLLDMQRSMRNAEDIVVPSCAASAKGKLLEYMSNAIESVSKFARQANDYETYMRFATDARAEFASEIEKLRPVK
jgi:hypothetical protein